MQADIADPEAYVSGKRMFAEAPPWTKLSAAELPRAFAASDPMERAPPKGTEAPETRDTHTLSAGTNEE